MRLVEQGKVELDAPVRRYLPDFTVADPFAAAQVTVRQLLDHSAGWLGDDYQDFGPGDDALARFVASMGRLPHLNAPGKVFAYNNAALCVAGRLIEVVTGTTCEAAVRKLIIDPLGLDHSRFSSDEIVGFDVAASHELQRMRSTPGPGGTLVVELDGMGVTWMLRPTAQGPRVVQHGGTWPGQISGFLMVPARGFALTPLTNSEGGTQLRNELLTDDWALERFAGGHQPAGRGQGPERTGSGTLRGPLPGSADRGRRCHGGRRRRNEPARRAAARHPDVPRSDFVRGPDGKVARWRNHGRLYRRQAP
ncbi:penicillin-binding protein [Streptomyces asoensis]|uniref:Penicillin-binding protein n=1 Tax=Streptomyces asoensis TaxID=249586 RepID=A0ABQ3S4M1_9ACTN|nr:penicillin-binding protein [Streptomyces asoensis]GHI63064.1 penicillin-binding protein [Streptomyces asoensis]